MNFDLASKLTNRPLCKAPSINEVSVLVFRHQCVCSKCIRFFFIGLREWILEIGIHKHTIRIVK